MSNLRKTQILFLTLILGLFGFVPGGLIPTALAQESQTSAIPPKANAFLTVVAYGTGGGALMGLASMAFYNKPRAIAQGASLGLYAGIIFGAYIIFTHEAIEQAPQELYLDDYDTYTRNDWRYQDRSIFSEEKFNQDYYGRTVATSGMDLLKLNF